MRRELRPYPVETVGAGTGEDQLSRRGRGGMCGKHHRPTRRYDGFEHCSRELGSGDGIGGHRAETPTLEGIDRSAPPTGAQIQQQHVHVRTEGEGFGDIPPGRVRRCH